MTEQEEAEQSEQIKKIEAISIEVDLLKAGVPMPSGNIYPLELLQQAVEELQDPIGKGSVIGQFDPPSHGAQVQLAHATHTVERLELDEEGVLSATLKIIPTPKGIHLLRFIEAGGEVRAAPRGFGTVGEGSVITEYTILTVDIHSLHSPGVVETEALNAAEQEATEQDPEEDERE
jgi:hypothetical protein